MAFRERIERFVSSCYGRCDHLIRFLLVLVILFFLAAAISKQMLFSLISWLILSYSLFRLLSRNIAARQREEAFYLHYKKALADWLRLRRRMFSDRRTYAYFRCPTCRVWLRVPKQQGRVCVTCRKCGCCFEKRT